MNSDMMEALENNPIRPHFLTLGMCTDQQAEIVAAADSWLASHGGVWPWLDTPSCVAR